MVEELKAKIALQGDKVRNLKTGGNVDKVGSYEVP